METIKVISGDKDGKDLRQEMARSKYYLRCDGKTDNEEINEALQEVGKIQWLGLGNAWDRIFGGK